MPKWRKTAPEIHWPMQKKRCPMCGSGDFRGRECMRCHYLLSETDQIGKEEATVPEQKKPVPKKRCPMCGNSVFRGRECIRCHHWLPEPTEPGKHGKGLKCPICASYTLADNLCGTCGARFVGDMVNRSVSPWELQRRERVRAEWLERCKWFEWDK